MIRHRVLLLGCLLLVVFVPTALAFVDSPVLVPQHPVAGETVSISIGFGACDGWIDRPGYPKITRNGNSIRILLAATHAPSASWCNVPITTAHVPIGTFGSGSYVLQLDRTYQDFFGNEVVETFGTISFTVAAAQPTLVPALGVYGIALLLLGVLVLAVFALHRRRAASLFTLPLLLLPLCGHAQPAPDTQVIALLLNSDHGAPSAQAVVNYYASKTRNDAPPLASLAAGNPKIVAYLLPLRAHGDFAAFLAAHSNSTRAKLERYLVAEYPPGADTKGAVKSMVADPKVAVAYTIPTSTFSSVQLLQFRVEDHDVPTQYGRSALDIDAAWQLEGGYALVGMIDSGLAVDHPALRQFSATGQYLGGNFIPIASLDVGGWPNTLDGDVDEAEPLPLPPSSPCNLQGLPAIPPFAVGHGTHTSGLLAANSASGLGIKGTCKHCGIAMWKVAATICDPYAQIVRLNLNGNAIPPSITNLADYGAQVISMSFGGQRDPDYCANNPEAAYCLALTYARDRDVMLVAASGNSRIKLNFPASDPQVVAAGGFEESLSLWDESPGSFTYCPYSNGSECGSNYTTVAGGPKQELMASAGAVLSTIYPGYDWNPDVQCGDSFGTPMGDGIGLCTGTSMSAPQIAGVMGIMRSINPLVPVGKPTYNPLLEVMGVRYVVANTTSEVQGSQAWSPTFGYGHPDAAAAARMMLGKVAGAVVRNRATPLFRLVSVNPNDHAAVTSPQYAVGLSINQANNYAPAGTLVPNYPVLPTESGITLPAPRAGAYVLSTDVKPRNAWPDLIPLHLLSKDTGAGFDFMLVTTDSDVEQAHMAGYDLRNIQGYIYQPCSPEPACIPPGAERFYRACKSADNDCAVFVESERAAFEADGFTSAWPTGSNQRIGYAYAPGDSDNDGLPDGFEYVIGSNPNLADSDGDTVSDGVEFPMVAVAIRDPCAGGTHGASLCMANIIFDDGFESL